MRGVLLCTRYCHVLTLITRSVWALWCYRLWFVRCRGELRTWFRFRRGWHEYLFGLRDKIGIRTLLQRRQLAYSNIHGSARLIWAKFLSSAFFRREKFRNLENAPIQKVNFSEKYTPIGGINLFKKSSYNWPFSLPTYHCVSFLVKE